MVDKHQEWPFRYHEPWNFWLELILALLAFSTLLLYILLPPPSESMAENTEDTIVVLDVSASMQVIEPGQQETRLEIAKKSTMELLSQLEATNVGLILQSGSAFWAMPLSNNRTTFQQFLNEANTFSISDTGTQIKSAVKLLRHHICHNEGTKVKTLKCHPQRPTTIIFVSDGEYFDDHLNSYFRTLAGNGISFIFLAIGLEAGSVPSFDILGNNSGVRINMDGSPVISAPRYDLMDKLAKITGGKIITPDQIEKHLVQELLQEPEQKDWHRQLLWTALLVSFLWIIVRKIGKSFY